MFRSNDSAQSFVFLKPFANAVRSSAGGRCAVLAVALIAGAGAGLSQTNTLPDAQVEANVLKALASAPELASEAITTRTVYGTVTLSGTVASETLRSRAENLAANSLGVKKVVDELTLGSASAGDASAANGSGNGPGPGMVLQSDGSYAPADNGGGQAVASNPQQPVRNDPDNDQALDQQMEAQQNGQQQAPNAGYPSNNTPQAAPQAQNYPPNYPQQNYPPQNGHPPQNGYPQQQNGYPQAQNYPQPNYPRQYPQQPYPQPGYTTHGYAAPVDGGQVGGEVVTVPSGTLIRLRINEPVSSSHSTPGQSFDGIVINDVVAGSAIAIPRGAAVRGTILDAKPSGVLKGRGELTLQLNQITLAGKTYPIVSDSWAHNGGDKTIETVNRTVGLGAFGALIGAVAGGGAGAAIGAGAGATAGLGSSAASGRGQVFLPAEAVLTFHLAQPATLTTVSEQEMQRLAYGVPAGGGQEFQRRPAYARPYPYPYPAPVPYGYPQ